MNGRTESIEQKGGNPTRTSLSSKPGYFSIKQILNVYNVIIITVYRYCARNFCSCNLKDLLVLCVACRVVAATISSSHSTRRATRDERTNELCRNQTRWSQFWNSFVLTSFLATSFAVVFNLSFYVLRLTAHRHTERHTHTLSDC